MRLFFRRKVQRAANDVGAQPCRERRLSACLAYREPVRADAFAFSVDTSTGCSLCLLPNAHATNAAGAHARPVRWSPACAGRACGKHCLRAACRERCPCATARVSCLSGNRCVGCVCFSAETTAGCTLRVCRPSGKRCGCAISSGEVGVSGGCLRVLLVRKVLRADAFALSADTSAGCRL